MNKKYCPRCKREKPVDSFGKRTNRPGQYSSYCRKCLASYYQKRYQNLTTTQKLAIQKRHAAYQRKWYEKNRRHVLDQQCSQKYGLSVSDYRELCDHAKNVCQICGQPETITYRKRKRALVIDHNHKTGKIRGILCNKCNTLLGYANDSVNRLKVAIKYLNKENP